MYSKKIIAENLSKLEAKRGKPLTYHAYPYIQQCISHLNSLAQRNDKGKLIGLTRPLAQDEADFIENERLLCALDYHYWATNYHKIRDSTTLEMIPYRPNLYQQVLTLAQARMEEQRRPIFIQLLKARQGGGTTDTTSKIEHRSICVPNTSGVIASSDPDKSWKLSEMITRSLAEMPWWMIPPDFKRFDSGEVFLECASRNITVSIQHGAQTSGISRGDTINMGHFSELPGYNDAERTIEAGFMHTVHPSEKTLIVFESTAEGRNDWWHKFWERNKADYADNLTLIQPLFLPWYLSRAIYPTEAWLRSVPIPTSYEPSEYVKEHARKAEDYVKSNELLREVMGSNWTMPIEQLWYYQFHYDRAKLEDKLGTWLSEMPSSDTEAFQSRSKSVFSIELIQEYEVRTPQPVGIYAIQGTEVPSFLYPEKDKLLPDGKPLDISYQSTTLDHAGVNSKCDWTLYPLKFDGYPSIKSHHNTLWIWEYPQENEEYSVGLDASEGVDKDATVVTVVRKGTPLRPAGQVAMFSSKNIGGLEIWPICLLLLHYYSTFHEHTGKVNEALFIPETASDGASALNEVRKRGWGNIYIRRMLEQRDQTSERFNQLGWKTNVATRKLLVSWLIKVLRGRFIELGSPWTVDQMRDFVAKDPPAGGRINGELRIEHSRGSHDDELFSLALAIVGLHELDIYQGENPQWASLVASVRKILRLPTYRDHIRGATFRPEELSPSFNKDGSLLFPTNVIT